MKDSPPEDTKVLQNEAIRSPNHVFMSLHSMKLNVHCQLTDSEIDNLIGLCMYDLEFAGLTASREKIFLVQPAIKVVRYHGSGSGSPIMGRSGRGSGEGLGGGAVKLPILPILGGMAMTATAQEKLEKNFFVGSSGPSNPSRS